jgi:hypothetical protein
VRKTFQRLLTEYGLAAVVVYFTIFFAVLFGAWAAIGAGWQPTGALANVGAFTAAYLFTKVTQPVRIGATIVLAPLAAKAWERITGRRPGGIVPPVREEPRA